MVEKGWVRDTVNAAVGRVRRIFKHAVADELIEPGVLQRLQAVSPLLAGRTEAPDLPPRTSVPDTAIEAVKGRVSPLVRDLIELQRLTGARRSRVVDVDAGHDPRPQTGRTLRPSHPRRVAAVPHLPLTTQVDVGHCIQLYADFTQSGKNYQPFPDPTSFQIWLADLEQPEIRERLRAIWLDPSRISAKVTRELAERLAKLIFPIQSVVKQSMVW